MSLVTTLPGADGRARPQRQSWLPSLLATLRLWRKRARERAQLANFSLRELHDIGLSNADAMQEASKPFWRP
jgi:uncharacterized protein YjiS (DUF1127 family)